MADGMTPMPAARPELHPFLRCQGGRAVGGVTSSPAPGAAPRRAKRRENPLVKPRVIAMSRSGLIDPRTVQLASIDAIVKPSGTELREQLAR